MSSERANKNGKRPAESNSPSESASKLSYWERGFKSLVAFQKKYGHTNVPYRYEEDRTLGTWTARQRKLKDELSDYQREQLEAIGFTWESTQDRAWMEKFDRLKAFWEREGHSCVPTSYPEDPELGEWTAQQRQKATQGRLSPERRELLDSVKFVYRINKFIKRKSTVREDKKWFDQLERLTQFLLEHGHTLVPFQYFADKSLGRWVNEQRCQNMRGLLREDRREILSNIGFVWKVHSRKGSSILPEGADDNTLWAYSFRQLVEYKHETGNFPTARAKDALGQWATQQRRLMTAGKLDEMKALRLAAIGFCVAGVEEIWEANYEKLQEQGYDSIFTLGDPYLAHWVIVQRYLYKKGELSQERKIRLFDIRGFEWDSSPINMPKPESKHVLKEQKRGSNNKENKMPAAKATPAKSTGLSANSNKKQSSAAATSEKKKPAKKRGGGPDTVGSMEPSMETPTRQAPGFSGLLAIASSFRTKEDIPQFEEL